MTIEYIRLKFDNQGQLTKAATTEPALEAVLIDNFNIEDRRIMLQRELSKSNTDNRIKMSLFASNTDGKYTLFYNGLCCLYEKLRNNTKGSSAVSGMINIITAKYITPPPSEYYTFSSPNELHCKSFSLIRLDFTKQPTSFTIDSQKIDTVVFQNTDLSWYSAPINLKNKYIQSGVPNKEEFGSLADMKTLYNPNVKSVDIGCLTSMFYSDSSYLYTMGVTVSLDTNDPKNNILRFRDSFTGRAIDGINTSVGGVNSSTNLLTKNNTKEASLLITNYRSLSWAYAKILIGDTLLEPDTLTQTLKKLTEGIYKKYTNINVINYQDLQASDLNDKPRLFSIICSTSNVGYMKTESKVDIYNQSQQQATGYIKNGSRIATPVPSDSYIYLVEALPSYDTPAGDSNGIGDSDTLMVIKVDPSDFNKFGFKTYTDNVSTYGIFGFFQELFKNKDVNISSGNIYIDYKNNKYGTNLNTNATYFTIPTGYSNPFIANKLIPTTGITTNHSSIPDDLYKEFQSFMTIPFKDLP